MPHEKCPQCERDLEAAVDTSSLVSCPTCKALVVPSNATHVSLLLAPDQPPDQTTPAAPRRAPIALSLSVQFLRKYHLERVLGYGAASTVYLARTSEAALPVAIKFLTANEGALLDRFLSEGRLMAEIRHQNVVAVTEIHELEGYPYLVTEYVDGGSLAERLAKRPRLPVGPAIDVMLDLLSGLEVLHQRGIVHRDLKPANVLLTRAGQAKLTDLGLAKDTERDGEPLTQAGTIVGTPLYMSPEQLSGDTATPASDVYSAGVILFEMISGVTPHHGKSLRELLPLKLTQDAPTLASAVSGGVPEELTDLVARTLAREPIDRPPTSEFLVRLRRIREALPAAQTPTTARPTRGTRPLRRVSGRIRVPTRTGIQSTIPPLPAPRRQPPMVAALTAAGLALVAFGLFSFFSRSDLPSGGGSPFGRAGHVEVGGPSLRSSAPEPPADPSPPPLRQPSPASTWSPPPAVELQPQARWGSPRFRHDGPVNALALVDGGRQVISCGADRTVRLFDGGTGVEVGSVTLEFAAVCLALSGDGARAAVGREDGAVELLELPGLVRLNVFKVHSGPVRVVVFGLDGSLVSAGDDKTVRVTDSGTGKLSAGCLGHRGAVLALAVHPKGGRFVSSGSDGTIRVWDQSSGKELSTFPGQAGTVRTLCFSPDGRWVLAGSQEGALRLYDAATGRELRTLSGHPGGVLAAAFSPVGTVAITGGQDRQVRIWKVETGKLVRSIPGSGAAVTSLAIGPDRTWAASASQDGTIRFFGLRDGHQIRTGQGHGGAVTTVVYNPTLKLVLSGGQDGKLILWDARAGREIKSLGAHEGAVLAAAFAPDAHRVLSAGADRTLRLFEVPTGRSLLELRGHTDGVDAVAFTPDGRLVISGGLDHLLKVWDCSMGKETASADGHAQRVSALAVSPDGRLVLSASWDQTLRLWELPALRPVRTFSGHSHHVLAVAFAPDGGSAVSGGADGVVKLWDVTPGRELRSFGGPGGAVESVRYSPDGRMVWAIGALQAIKAWDVRSGQELGSWRPVDGSPRWFGGGAALLGTGHLSLIVGTERGSLKAYRAGPVHSLPALR